MRFFADETLYLDDPDAPVQLTAGVYNPSPGVRAAAARCVLLQKTNFNLAPPANVSGAIVPIGWSGPQPPPTNPASLYDPRESRAHQALIVAYKNTRVGRIYSGAYATGQAAFTANAALLGYEVKWTWAPSPGADGYLLFESASAVSAQGQTGRQLPDTRS